jgi:hypothetical protein
MAISLLEIVYIINVYTVTIYMIVTMSKTNCNITPSI